jgi:hypothetical protein
MDLSLNGYALEWGSEAPRLVRYLGRVVGNGAVGAMIEINARRVIVPHSTVFWFGGICKDLAIHSLMPCVGHA